MDTLEGEGESALKKILPLTTLSQALQGPLHGILYTALALRIVAKIVFNQNKQTKKKDNKTEYFMCSEGKTNSRFNASFLQKLNKTQRGIYKCHLLRSRLVTFIFININPENPTDDTGTAVRGRVPS